MDRFLIGIVTAIGGEIAKYTVAPIGRQLGYLVYYHRNVDNLNSQIENLEKKKTIIDRQVEEVRRKGDESEENVKDWLSEVVRTCEEAKNVLKDEGHSKANCSCSWSFPHLVLRHRLSRKVKKMAETIVSEIDKADAFKSISYTPVLHSSFVNKGFEAFDSRVLTSKEIVEALKDPNLSTIGVYGMGGIGKTTLVKDIARKVLTEELFSEVVMVTLTQSLDLKSVQQEIAEKLGVRLLEETISARANRLQHRFSREDKILIILDDIWEELKLEDAGIYFRDDQRGCKILLISRDRYVLCNLMGVDKDFQVKVLTSSEAMKLFNKFVGDTINENPDFKRLATALVGECGGLPIAIETIACALRNRPIRVWTDALQQVKRSPRQGYGKAYSSIRTSYDVLGSEEKSILLLCSLYKEDAIINVENLTNIYAAGSDLFREMDTLEEARNRVHTLVDRLQASCLLLDGDYSSTIKVHDTIRDIVLSIASEDERMYCFTSITKLEESLSLGKIKDSAAISLFDRDFTKLPEDLACPSLRLLLIFDRDQNKISRKRYENRPMLIPNECFAESKELRALCLDSVILKSSPSCFYSLESLQTLSLQGCTLENIALIGELKNLIVLNLSFSNFKELPKQIGRLTRLRLLNLKGCENLRVIQPNVISNLVQLEELYMDDVFIGWDEYHGIGRNASLVELENLLRLRALFLTIQDQKVIPIDLFSEKLERYNIAIGRFIKRERLSIESSKLLRLEDCRILLYQHGFQMLIKRSEVLHLDRFHGVSNIVSQLDEDGFPHLKNLLVEESDEVQHIVESAGQIQPCGALQNLETLTLKRLRNLEMISNGELTTASFCQLRSIKILHCGKLKNLFSVSKARRLEYITVSSCKLMEEIFYHGSDDQVHDTMRNNATTDNIIAFPHLRSLKMSHLANLIQFLNTYSSRLNSTKPLFNQQVVFPRLKVLELAGTLNFSELWENQLPTTSSMQNITRLKVYDCRNLKYLLSVAIGRSLVQLESLEISNCPVMEEVVVINEPAEESRKRKEYILFPRLRYLKLSSLPSLRKFTALLSVTGIDRELNQPFFSGKVAFPSLEELIVDECEALKYLLSYEAARSLLHLQFINVRSCEIMEEVVVTQEPREETKMEKISFPRLERLELSTLPNLKRFCSADCVECPSLLTLNIHNCPGLGTSTANSTPAPTKEEKNADLWLSAVNENVAFPDPKLLQLSQMSFRNLGMMIILQCNNLEYLLPFAAVGSLSLLKQLRIYSCEIMQQVILLKDESREDKGLKKISFPKLETLELRNLQNLRNFCNADCFDCPSLLKLDLHDCPEFMTFVANSTSQFTEQGQVEETDSKGKKFPLFNNKVVHPAQSFQTLTTRDVTNCGRLKTLAAISCYASFQNLGDLQVSKCHGMINLLDSLSAKTLVQLTKLKITDCQKMTEVIAKKEGGEQSTDLVFSLLKSLILHRLPNLKSFHGGVSDIQFPHLKKVIVSECPEMKIFTDGTTITPELDKVIAELNLERSTTDPEYAAPIEELWEGDLNTSIRRLWEKNDTYTALNRLFSENGQEV